MTGDKVPSKRADCFLCHPCLTGPGVYPASCPIGTRDYFPEGKAARIYECDFSSPSSAEVKNICSFLRSSASVHGVVLNLAQIHLHDA